MLILSILLSLTTFIVGYVIGMFVLMAGLERKGMLKDKDKEQK